MHDYISDSIYVYKRLRCGHCKRFEPEYKKAAEEVDGLDASVILTAIDATSEKNTVAKYGMQLISIFATIG